MRPRSEIALVTGPGINPTQFHLYNVALRYMVNHYFYYLCTGLFTLLFNFFVLRAFFYLYLIILLRMRTTAK